MAEIHPFKAWRYSKDLTPQLDNLVSPLFDVVSQKQRDILYKNPLNSIHLSVPLGENPSENAEKLLNEWKQKGIITQDSLPGIYVYYQYFRIHGSKKEYCRKGFITLIKAYDWSENVILRHENTLPGAVNDRIELLEKTKLNVSSTHGLYTDERFILEAYMDEAIKNPLYETEDYQGVRDVLAVIHDAKIIKLFVNTLADKQIFLADGHHRYEGSLVYRKKMMEKFPNNTGKEAFHYHMMYLTNTESDDLRILPTHRIIKDLPPINHSEFLSKLEQYFIIKDVDDVYEVEETITGKKWAFGLLLKDSCFKLKLKPEVFELMEWKFPKEVLELDLSVMHYFIIEKCLGIPGKEHRSSSNIAYIRSFPECIDMVQEEKAQMAFITNEISMEEVKKVCFSGSVMPPKSTYFFPKTICGFLFGSIEQSEFESAFDSYFSIPQ
jgi:uncharacterized protein (DUF1015 family)